MVAAPTSAKCTASAQPSPSTSVRFSEEVEKSRTAKDVPGAQVEGDLLGEKVAEKGVGLDSPIAESDAEERFGNDTLDILEERQLRRGVWFDIENKRRNIILENGPAESRRSQSSRAMALHCARH